MAEIKGTGLSQKDLVSLLTDTVALVNELKTNLNAVNAKLDADGGVTDTNYAALHDASESDLSLTQ